MRLRFGRRRRDEELDEEIRSHLEMAIRDRIERGESPEEAAHAARREFGNEGLVRETTREMWGWGWVERLFTDIRYGLRMLRKSPGFTAVAIITLALGIGANAAVFSVISAVYLRPLPLKDGSRLVTFSTPPVTRWIETTQKGQTAGHARVSWIDHARTIKFATLCLSGTVDFSDGKGTSQPVQASEVSSNFFPLFGLEPRIGSGLGAATRGKTVAELSYGFWQERYGGAPSVLGKTVELNGKPFTIAGVLPRGFDFPDGAKVWMPLPTRPGFAFPRLTMARKVARLAPGASLGQARTELNTIAQNLPFSIIQGFGRRADVEPLQGQMAGFAGPLFLLLFVSAGLLFLIACAGVANLLLARGSGRLQEMALRSALGGTRGRLVRQLLTESLMLSLAGAGVGLLIGWPGIAFARGVAPVPALLARGISLNAWVLGFATVAAVAATALSGVLPALAASRLAPGEALKSGAPGALSAGRGRATSRLQSLLGVTEIALACMLTICAGLLIHSFWKVANIDPGFRPDHVATAAVSLTGPAYKTPLSRVTFYRQALERVRAVPGVRDAAFGTPPLAFPLFLRGRLRRMMLWMPSRILNSSSFSMEGVGVSPRYFRTLGIPLLEGRSFNAEDTPTSRRVAIVNEAAETLALFHGRNPLGRVVYTDGNKPATVVGVVGNVSETRLDARRVPTIYSPITQAPGEGSALLVRTAGDPAAVTSAVREAVHEVDPGVPVSQFRTMRQAISLSLTGPRFRVTLLGLFAGLAVLLAVLGVYGVVAHAVSRRTHEIGIRLAMGAEPVDVWRMVLRQAAWLALAGVGFGVAAAAGLARLLAWFLYGVAPLDPLTFALVPLLLAGVAIGACLAPAWRAARVDPNVALRYE